MLHTLRTKTSALLVVIGVWTILVVAGFGMIWSYGALSGSAGAAPVNWPAVSQIQYRGRHTLVFFAHPMCPCTRSSLSELAKLAALIHKQVDIHVIFISPAGSEPEWADSDLVSAARCIPGVNLHFDIDRHESELFHACTSGCCMLYDNHGRLQFEGGLTIARGHEGDSEGSRIVLALINGASVKNSTTSARSFVS